MLGALSISPNTVASLTFSPENFSPSSGAFRSVQNVFNIGRNRCKLPSIRAAVAEVAPALERRSPESLYEVLKVKQNASPTEIKTAYRTLAKLYHPDAATRVEEISDGRYFIQIHKAYETLSDPTARALYDLTLSLSSNRRRPVYAADGLRSSSRLSRTRRWETDQCW